jgi:hypothetical protein
MSVTKMRVRTTSQRRADSAQRRLDAKQCVPGLRGDVVATAGRPRDGDVPIDTHAARIAGR